MENGVKLINGSDPLPPVEALSSATDAPVRPRSRSVSPTRTGNAPAEEPPKEKRFLNGWSKEQEILMAEWSDLAMCYRWLHDKSEKYYHGKNLWINLPVIILTTLGGTANFGIQSMFDDDKSKRYASFAIGGISLFAGILTTLGNYLRYAQLEEAHRVASIAWGKFQRLIAVELALKPDDRMDSLDFLKICRADLDRLIEQSPPIPEPAIKMFEDNFGKIQDLKKPDICGALEHTKVFESSQTRLTHVLSEAALMIRHKRKALNELLSPQIQETIKKQVESRLSEAIEDRRKSLEEEIETEKENLRKQEEEYQRVLEERQRKIEADIEAEMNSIKLKRTATLSATSSMPSIPVMSMKPRHSDFESRLQLKQNPLYIRGVVPPERKRQEESKKDDTLLNVVVIPTSAELLKQDDQSPV
jgi:hypothetical protein